MDAFIAPNETGILVVRKKGRVNIVCQLTRSVTVWTLKSCANEKELTAPLVKQRSVWVASEDNFTMKILVFLRFILSSFLLFFVRVLSKNR